MLYKTKEIVVSLSAAEIMEKMTKLKRKSPFFQKIESDRFRIRVNSNRPSLYRTLVSGIISGRIISTDKKDVNRIVYHSEPPIIFWVFLLPFFAFLFAFFVHLFSDGIQLNIKERILWIVYVFLVEILMFAETVSQTNMSEERFLKAFEKERLISETILTDELSRR